MSTIETNNTNEFTLSQILDTKKKIMNKTKSQIHPDSRPISQVGNESLISKKFDVSEDRNLSSYIKVSPSGGLV